MSAQVIAFPRKKQLAWDDLPDYWGYVEKSYYEMAIEDGMSPEDAFHKQDLCARMPRPLMGLRYKTEDFATYIARLESVALSVDEARARLAGKA
ncbi:MAG: hypothetical protein ACREO7_07950 [Pseudoxanthomonas sp.]